MKKKKVLFIGHMLPENSSKAQNNLKFCKALKKESNVDLILLSDSWCNIHQANEISWKYKDLMLSDIFEKKYYVDPFQMKLSGTSAIGMIALFKKLKSFYSFDKVIISDFLDYILLCEVLREEEIVLLQYETMDFIHMDEYLAELAYYFMRRFKMLITSKKASDFFDKHVALGHLTKIEIFEIKSENND